MYKQLQQRDMAEAPVNVVMHGTPWATEALRIRPSSVRAPLPRGVLRIN